MTVVVVVVVVVVDMLVIVVMIMAGTLVHVAICLLLTTWHLCGLLCCTQCMWKLLSLASGPSLGVQASL